jgi:hypothetical protein
MDLCRVRPQHIDGISKLISLPLYERVIAIRDQVTISEADFALNSKFLESKYTKAQETSKEWLSKIRPSVILKG